MDRVIEAVLLVILILMGFTFLVIAIYTGPILGIVFCSLGIVLTSAWVVEYHLRGKK